MNTKDERIYKMWARKVPLESIVKKLGYNDHKAGMRRVVAALRRKKVDIWIIGDTGQ